MDGSFDQLPLTKGVDNTIIIDLAYLLCSSVDFCHDRRPHDGHGYVKLGGNNYTTMGSFLPTTCIHKHLI